MKYTTTLHARPQAYATWQCTHRKGNRGRWNESTIRRSNDEKYSRIALVEHHRNGRRDGLSWIVVGETPRVRSTELEGLIGEIDDHRAFDMVWQLSTPGSTQIKKTPTWPFVHVPHELWCLSANPCPATLHIESFLVQREGEHQRLAVSSTFHCHARQRKGSRRKKGRW